MRRREPPPPGPGERDVVVRGVRWRTRETDGGAGTPLLFVHGHLASSASWKHVLASAGGGRPGIAVDVPGFGMSDRPWPYDYTVEGWARSIEEFLDARGIGRAVLVGNSLGGAAVMVIAARRPDRVAALVLVDAISPETPIPWPAAALRTPVLGELALALSTRATVAIGLRSKIYARPSSVTPDAIDDAWRPLTIPGTRRAALAAIRSEPKRFLGLESRISVPTLVVWGEQDRLIPVSEAPRLAARIRGARLAIIPDAGHLPQREQPQRFSAEMRGFLAEVGV
jgi:pimeloyl-ACP methyl ester carboxylesterase